MRDVETRYKHSLLGLYWAIINPLVTAAIFGFVFGVIFHATSKPIPYVVYLLSGLTFWNFFTNGLMSATVSVSGNAALLAKIYFPRVVLPTASILARLIDLGFSALVLVVQCWPCRAIRPHDVRRVQTRPVPTKRNWGLVTP